MPACPPSIEAIARPGRYVETFRTLGLFWPFDSPARRRRSMERSQPVGELDYGWAVLEAECFGHEDDGDAG